MEARAAAAQDVPEQPLIRPIDDASVLKVGEFLNRHLNSRISPDAWARAMVPTWQVDAPNHGFMLLRGGEIVGAQLAFYSERETPNGTLRLCNIAAFAVLPEFRSHSFRLLRSILKQPGYVFTDLSPSGNVPALNERLGFARLDTSCVLVPNLACLFAPNRVRLLSRDHDMAEALSGRDLRTFRDHHRAQAALQLVLVDGARRCHVIYRRDRRKNLPLFATILHVSDEDLFRAAHAQVFRHLLGRGIMFTLLEQRVADVKPPLSRRLAANRHKMFRGSDDLPPSAIDYLYSELTCVAW